VELSIEEFHVPVGGSLDPENRWVLFNTLMPGHGSRTDRAASGRHRLHGTRTEKAWQRIRWVELTMNERREQGIPPRYP